MPTEMSPLLDGRAVRKFEMGQGRFAYSNQNKKQNCLVDQVSQDEKLHQWVMDRYPCYRSRIYLNMLHLLCKDLARKFGKEV